MPFLVLLYTIFKFYGWCTGKIYFHFLVLDFGHWLVRDYVPFRHQIFAPNSIISGRSPPFYHCTLTSTTMEGNQNKLELDILIQYFWTKSSGLCVCVFFPFILDVKFVGRTSRGHIGGRSHRVFHPPSFCGACLNFSREKDSAIPFPRPP